MAFQLLDFQKDGAVATCRFRHPPTQTLTNSMVECTRQYLADVAVDPQIRVIVFTGEGPFFIAHYEIADIYEMVKDAPVDETSIAALPLHPFHQLMIAIEALPQPTVAAINGSAAGGGLELALACDFRVMKRGDFSLSLPETNLGIIPGGGGTQRLARMIGLSRATELILLGRAFTAEQGLGWGLLHRIYDAADFDSKVIAFSKALAERAPIAMREAKRAIRQGPDENLAGGLALEQCGLYRTLNSRDAQNAMANWLAGRPVSFSGR